MPRNRVTKSKIADTDVADKEKMRNASFELAHLTASLKMAGIIPFPLDEGDDPSEFEVRNSPQRLIIAATQFLATCAEVQLVLKAAEDLKSEQAISESRLRDLSLKSKGSKH